MRRTVSLLLLGMLSQAGCSDTAGGPKLGRLSISVSSMTSLVLEPQCVRLPVLWGSRAEHHFEVAGDFAIHVEAAPDELSLSMRGVDDPTARGRSLNADQVRRGYSEDIEVTTLSGQSFTVHLEPVCEAMESSE